MHPKTHQVQVYAVGASDASAYLPIGSVATAMAAESTQSTLYKAAAKSELLEAGPMGDVSHLSEVTSSQQLAALLTQPTITVSEDIMEVDGKEQEPLGNNIWLHYSAGLGSSEILQPEDRQPETQARV